MMVDSTVLIVTYASIVSFRMKNKKKNSEFIEIQNDAAF